MSGRIDWAALLHRQTRVRATYANGIGVHAEGRLVGYSNTPQVLLRTDDGAMVWWSVDLTEVLPEKPPKPEEPTGLGAVVEDAEGGIWIRRESIPFWIKSDGSRFARIWPNIDAVRVLSEGVQA